MSNLKVVNKTGEPIVVGRKIVKLPRSAYIDVDRDCRRVAVIPKGGAYVVHRAEKGNGLVVYLAGADSVIGVIGTLARDGRPKVEICEKDMKIAVAEEKVGGAAVVVVDVSERRKMWRKTAKKSVFVYSRSQAERVALFSAFSARKKHKCFVAPTPDGPWVEYSEWISDCDEGRLRRAMSRLGDARVVHAGKRGYMRTESGRVNDIAACNYVSYCISRFLEV